MKEEEIQALHILNVSREYITRLLDEQITALTIKSLSVKMEEKDRIISLAGRAELLNFKSSLEERQKLLALKQKKEEEGKDGKAN